MGITPVNQQFNIKNCPIVATNNQVRNVYTTNFKGINKVPDAFIKSGGEKQTGIKNVINNTINNIKGFFNKADNTSAPNITVSEAEAAEKMRRPVVPSATAQPAQAVNFTGNPTRLSKKFKIGNMVPRLKRLKKCERHGNNITVGIDGIGGGHTKEVINGLKDCIRTVQNVSETGITKELNGLHHLGIPDEQLHIEYVSRDCVRFSALTQDKSVINGVINKNGDYQLSNGDEVIAQGFSKVLKNKANKMRTLRLTDNHNKPILDVKKYRNGGKAKGHQEPSPHDLKYAYIDKNDNIVLGVVNNEKNHLNEDWSVTLQKETAGDLDIYHQTLTQENAPGRPSSPLKDKSCGAEAEFNKILHSIKKHNYLDRTFRAQKMPSKSKTNATYLIKYNDHYYMLATSWNKELRGTTANTFYPVDPESIESFNAMAIPNMEKVVNSVA